MLVFGFTASCIKLWKWKKSCIRSLIIAINGKGKAKIHHLNQKQMFCSVLMATTNGLYLGNFRDFRDFRDFRLSDTSFLIKNGLFFLKREIPKIFSNLFYTHSTPRFQSSIRNFQNQPCMTPPNWRKVNKRTLMTKIHRWPGPPVTKRPWWNHCTQRMTLIVSKLELHIHNLL